jgi:hypothetical protein
MRSSAEMVAIASAEASLTGEPMFSTVRVRPVRRPRRRLRPRLPADPRRSRGAAHRRWALVRRRSLGY